MTGLKGRPQIKAGPLTPPGVSPRSERNLKSRRGGVKGADDIWMVDLIPRKESVDLQVGLRDTGNEGVILHNHNTPD